MRNFNFKKEKRKMNYENKEEQEEIICKEDR